jgi:hypothetical protein
MRALYRSQVGSEEYNYPSEMRITGPLLIYQRHNSSGKYRCHLYKNIMHVRKNAEIVFHYPLSHDASIHLINLPIKTIGKDEAGCSHKNLIL